MADSPAIARRRALYKPIGVRVLLIGESAPAGGTHFYLANSNLFRAVRTAFVGVYGQRVPEGTEFLRFFSDEGYWLLDLASEPVNRLPMAARAAAVRKGLQRISRTIRATKPYTVVAVKKSIVPSVVQAIAASGEDAPLVALPFPAMGWQEDFIEGLRSVVRRTRRIKRQPPEP